MNRKTFAALALGASAVIAILLAAGLKRVPSGNEALLIGRDGRSAAYGPGLHFIRPLSGTLAVYPFGEVALRYPREGNAPVVLKDGRETQIALTVRLDIPRGSAERLRGILGEDFSSGIDGLLRDGGLGAQPRRGESPQGPSAGIHSRREPPSRLRRMSALSRSSRTQLSTRSSRACRSRRSRRAACALSKGGASGFPAHSRS